MPNESGLAPLEYNVVIRMDPVEEKTSSGLYIPQSKVERDELSADEGTLVAISEHAFSYAEWQSRKPQIGDRVLLAQFDGRIWKRNGVTYRLIKDKSVIAVIEQSEQSVQTRDPRFHKPITDDEHWQRGRPAGQVLGY